MAVEEEEEPFLLMQTAPVVESLFSLSADRDARLRHLLADATTSSSSLWNKLRAVNWLLATDLEHQLFYFRKLCSCLPLICGTMHVWSALLKFATSAAASLFFLLSHRAGPQCARRIVGRVYQNALHVCVMAEIARTCVAATSFALHHDSSSSRQQEFAMEISNRLTTALLNMTVSASVPPSLLASHLVMCVSNVTVEILCQSLQHLSRPVLEQVLKQLNGLYARLRLAVYRVCPAHVAEVECPDEEGGASWCLADVSPNTEPEPHE
jgi:hypothetical protein